MLFRSESLEEADAKMTAGLTPQIIEGIVKLIPDAWLVKDSPFADSNQHRDAYVKYFLSRLEQPHSFVEEAIRARSIPV